MNHYVSGFFANKEEAETTLASLIENGFPVERVNVVNTHIDPTTSPTEAKSNEALKDIVVDGAIGAGIGTGIGALVEVALVATNVTLFVASPLIAPLALLGWGASLGALAGTTLGSKLPAEDKGGKFSDMVRDAISSGHTVLVAVTTTEAETRLAQQVIKAAIDNPNNMNTSLESSESMPRP